MKILLFFLVFFISGCVSNVDSNLKNDLFQAQSSLGICSKEIENSNVVIIKLNAKIKELEDKPKTICNKDGSMCIGE
ncbi:hypothetical protein KFZ76_08025 [Methylovulum psychrotolerans]|uniref:hypothetical protein n=1 Tax=Methylovulum psychrotolerans TaxID=1704499 RepID=UPI001BFF7CF7|nr:hypothetical protein [Methylovulum psychrotolerans]MBT9097653.1 hypothetical protein [Methylovulum psychrotolerans]